MPSKTISELTAQTPYYNDLLAFCASTGTYAYKATIQTIVQAGLSIDFVLSKTITATGTNGAQTINKSAGSVNFAAGATSLVVTNSLVTANSIVIPVVAANDTTMKTVSVVQASGSFTLYPNAAPTAATRVNFLVIN